MSEDHQDRSDAEPVPKLPRGRGISLSTGEIIRIGMFGALLVGVIYLQRPCAENTARFVDSFEEPIDAAVEADPVPANVVHLTGEVTEEELKAKIEALQQAAAEPPPTGSADGGVPPGR